MSCNWFISDSNHWLFAKFATLSYDDSPRYHGNGWEPYITRSSHELVGFFASSFVNHDLKAVVVAFKGSDIKFPFSDWWGSNICFISSIMKCEPAQYVHADSFAKKILEHYAGYCAVLVGHSLGGGLAQLVGIKRDIPSVTFDSPGTLYPAQHLFSESQYKNAKIIAYVSAPNIVNGAGEHLAPLIEVVDTTFITDCDLWGGYLHFTLSQHDMEKILDRFDEETGKPIRSTSTTRDGMFNTQEKFAKLCGAANSIEMQYLVNCPSVLSKNESLIKLLKGSMIFEKNFIQIEQSFPFLKSGKKCEGYSYKVLAEEYREEVLEQTKNEFYDYINAKSKITQSNNKESGVRQDAGSNDVVDIYTTYVRWSMESRDVIFYGRSMKDLCGEYLCHGISKTPIHDEF
ncbi:MAG: DUF2974 domain-containing protein [Alphaproteobacteria bacterium]|nr:DUF2974 domain-containing protein [Alphaproteobacteria bacterium]